MEVTAFELFKFILVAGFGITIVAGALEVVIMGLMFVCKKLNLCD